MVTALAFLKSIPSWAWVAVAAVALIAGAYLKGASDKNSEWEARLAKAEQQAAEEAEAARESADESSNERELAHAATQAAIRKALEDAEKDNTNPIDILLGSL
jgi:flagellar biosynthesis component FlhA